MKKFLMMAALLATMPVFADHVDPETARKVATSFLSNNGAKSAQLTDLSKAVGFPNLYIFTGEEGFVVMAADDRVKPILGYSLTGKFVTENMPENLVGWLQGYNEQIQDAINNNLSAETSVKTEWHDLKEGTFTKEAVRTAVSPLITTSWDQNYPYNSLCPTNANGPGGHAYAGCVATAMAQIMKYWEYPNTYLWENMPNSISSTSDPDEIEAIAKLISDCGVAVDMNYGAVSSGAWSGMASDALKNVFLYAPSATYVSKESYEDAQWIAFLKHELDEGRPLFYNGNYIGGGHAFVCDGYRSDDYFHFNWGWSGSDGPNGNDGYWVIGALNPNNTYNLNNAVIAWAEPIYDLTAPILSASISENAVTLTWDAIASALSYDIYKDNAIIAHDVTTLSYTDNNTSFGEYPEYYIRAKSSTGKSNPSNRITLTNTYQNRIPQNPNAEIAISDNSIVLTWTEPQSHSMDLHYGTGQIDSYYGLNNNTYWGQCYPSQTIGSFNGMAIDNVSIYIGHPGSYTLLLYKDDVTSEANLLASKSFSGTIGWNEITLDNAIPLDITQDLWVVFNSSANSPAYLGNYDGENKEHAHYLWNDFNTNTTYTLYSENISWPIKIHLTDGAFTYNIYRDNTLIAEQQSSNSYRDENLTDGTHEYMIKAYANHWESDASNTVSVPYSTEHRISEATTITDNLTLSSHNKYVIESTGTLTVTGTLSNDDHENLVIESGAQLISNSENVEATVKRDIETFSDINDKGHWYLIASPMTDEFPVEETNLTSTTDSNYDLFIFDQNEEGLEWRNYKRGRFTHIKNKVGYLYASAENTCVTLAGTLNNTDGEVTLTYSNNETTFRGYNLIGNPFPCNATIGRSFYRIVENNGVSELQPVNSGTVYPMEGIVVQAQNASDYVTFIKETPAAVSNENNDESILMDISQGQGSIDRAIVCFDKGNSLGKIMLNPENTKLYIPQDSKEYAIATCNKQGELPVNFKAKDNGTYTLTISGTLNPRLSTLNFNYLHLIDRFTGADIDLLVTPSYSFEAKTSDLASRFLLMLHPIEEEQTDDDIIEGNQQIFDVTGRLIGNDPNMKLTPGVYILQTTQGNKVKIEKIIIK